MRPFNGPAVHSSFARDGGAAGFSGFGGGDAFAAPAGGRISMVAAWKKSESGGFDAGGATGSTFAAGGGAAMAAGATGSTLA